jgi:hypothetical protein
MTFLAPAALLGTFLLAIPVIVHLLKPRKMRQTPFSSLRWLKQTHQRLSRRIRWHQWLLFLLRAACIFFLVLALARPLAGLRDQGKPTDRFVILDVGRAMAYETRGVPSPLETARDLAVDLLQNGSPGDRTAVLLAGARPRLVCSLTADPAAHLPAVQAAQAEAGDCRLAPALSVVRSLIGRGEAGRDVELVVLTSNRQRAWQQGAIQTFLQQVPAPPRVQVVELGPAAIQNAWVADARLVEGGDQADVRLLRVSLGAVGDVRQERTVRLTGIAGLADDVQPVTITPGQSRRVDFKIPSALGLSGQVAEVRLEPADALPGDDHYLVPLDVRWALRLLIVEPEAPGPEGRGAGHYLRTGRDALAVSGNQALKLVRRSSKAVTPGDFRKADVVFLAGISELSDAALEALEARVRSGGGLVLFLGPGLNPAFYNEKLYRPLQPAQGLLPSPLKTGPEQVRRGEPGALTALRWSHPLLAPLHDPLLGDLALIRCRRFASFTAAPLPGDAVLARIDDGEPALIEHALGAGRVLVCNTTADDTWSDLPRRDAFVPLLDRMISYLSAGSVRRHFTAGEPVSLPLADGQVGEEVTVTTPAGRKLTQRLAGRGVLGLEDATETGVYRVERAGKDDVVFAVNADPSASPLTPMDTRTLEQWWAPAAVEFLSAEDAARRFGGGTSGFPLWPALILAACLLLLVETIYVYRLCPRLNPAVAESVVSRRGLLRPLNEKTAPRDA